MEPQNTKIMIAVPTTGWVHYKAASVITHIAGTHHTAMVYGCDRPHDVARNRLVKIFLKHPTLTHLFFIDSDVEPPLNVLERLLALDAPVASGCYRILQPEGLVWSLAMKNKDGKYLLMPELPAERFEADGCGGGCLLIRRDVLDARLLWPWFRWVEGADGKQMGEDIYFCKKLNDAGLRVTVDPACVCVHHKTVGL